MGIFQCHVRFQGCSSYWLGILHMFDRKDLAALPAVLKLQPWQSCNFGNLSHLPPPRRSLRAYLSQELKARSFTSSGGLDFHTRQTKTIFTFRIVVPFCHVGRKIAAIAKMFKISCFCPHQNRHFFPMASGLVVLSAFFWLKLCLLVLP